MAKYLPRQIVDGNDLIGKWVQENFDSVEARTSPVRAGDIDGFYMDRAIWGRAQVPAAAINVNELLNSATGLACALGTLDVRRGLFAQYRDASTLYATPGHILHRGKFKRQGCQDNGLTVVLNVNELLIPGDCAPVDPGTSTGLSPESWYYVYVKMDVSQASPEYRITDTEPVWCPGYGPEHPRLPELRFIGSIRTDVGPGADILPFNRNELGWVFWRERVTGFMAGVTDAVNAAFTARDLSDAVPPTADNAHMTFRHNQDPNYIRVTGDSSDPDGYGFWDSDDAKDVQVFTIPVNVLDPATDLPVTGTSVDTKNADDTALTVVGYHEAI